MENNPAIINEGLVKMGGTKPPIKTNPPNVSPQGMSLNPSQARMDALEGLVRDAYGIMASRGYAASWCGKADAILGGGA